jgi:hypothetical protein
MNSRYDKARNNTDVTLKMLLMEWTIERKKRRGKEISKYKARKEKEIVHRRKFVGDYSQH